MALLLAGAAQAEEPRTQVRTGPLGATTPSLRGGATSAATLRVPLRSVHAMRWEDVVRQRTEIGCAAASLATILTYYFDFPATEDEMVQALYSEALSAPAPNLQEDLIYAGFNMLHIRNVARKGGLVAAAFRVNIDKLESVKIPVITRVTIRGYDHFVVFRQALGDRVYIADPAFGNTVYSMQDFEQMWSGVMMGFVRRGEAPAADHALQVEMADARILRWSEIERILARSLSEPASGADFGARVGRFSTFPFVSPQIEGLESVFPTLIINELEFGEDITF